MARVVRSVISTLPFSSTSPSRSPASGVVVGVGETGVGSAVGSDAVGEGDAVVGSGDGFGEGEEVGSGDGEGDGDGAGAVLISARLGTPSPHQSHGFPWRYSSARLSVVHVNSLS